MHPRYIDSLKASPDSRALEGEAFFVIAPLSPVASRPLPAARCLLPAAPLTNPKKYRQKTYPRPLAPNTYSSHLASVSGGQLENVSNWGWGQSVAISTYKANGQSFFA